MFRGWKSGIKEELWSLLNNHIGQRYSRNGERVPEPVCSKHGSSQTFQHRVTQNSAFCSCTRESASGNVAAGVTTRSVILQMSAIVKPWLKEASLSLAANPQRQRNKPSSGKGRSETEPGGWMDRRTLDVKVSSGCWNPQHVSLNLADQYSR